MLSSKVMFRGAPGTILLEAGEEGFAGGRGLELPPLDWADTLAPLAASRANAASAVKNSASIVGKFL